MILNDGISVYLDSGSLPDNVIEYAAHSRYVDRPIGSTGIVYGMYAEIDRDFPFENLKIGDVIEIKFEDAFQLIPHEHNGRITEILQENPLTFKTKRVTDINLSVEGVDYPITESEYRGKIIQIFSDLESAQKLQNGKLP